MKFRHFVFFIALIAVGAFAIAKFGEIQNFINLLWGASWWILGIVVLLRFLYYRLNALYFSQYFSIFDKKISTKELFYPVITMNFVNIIFPSGGISGISYLRSQFKDRAESSVTTLGQIVWYGLAFCSLVVLLLVGFVLLLFSKQVLKISSRIILLVLFVCIVVAVGFIILVANRGLTENILYLLIRPYNWILKRLHKSPIGRARINNFLEQIGDSLQLLKTHKKQLIKPFWTILAMFVVDILCVYLVFIAFGSFTNPGIAIAGYVIALLSSMASIITNGVGVYEAGMVATFSGLGIPFDLAFSVTFMYRFICLWLFLPIGLFLYRKTTKQKERKV